MKPGLSGTRRRVLCAVCLVLACLASACKSIVWSNTTEFYEAFWLDESSVIESTFTYQEKLPFPPVFVDTTLKRAYKTRLCKSVIAEDGTAGVCVPVAILDGREMGATFALWDHLFVLVETETGERVLLAVGFRPNESPRTVMQSAPGNGMRIEDILASPDRSKLAVQYRDEHSNMQFSVLKEMPSDQAIEKTPVLTVPSVAGLMTQLAWGIHSDRLYVKQGSDVLEWGVGGGAAGRAVTFPRCFEPPTANYKRVSDRGRTYFRESLEGPPKVGRLAAWQRFRDLPTTQKFSEIGAGCP